VARGGREQAHNSVVKLPQRLATGARVPGAAHASSTASGQRVNFEYKTIVLPFHVGLFKQGLPDIQSALNKEGQQGWRFKQIVLPSTEWGRSDSMVAILERAIDLPG